MSEGLETGDLGDQCVSPVSQVNAVLHDIRIKNLDHRENCQSESGRCASISSGLAAGVEHSALSPVGKHNGDLKQVL